MKEIDAKRRDILVSENLKAERNTLYPLEIAQAKRKIKKMVMDKIAAMQTLSAEVKALDTELAEIDAKLTDHYHSLPNIPADSVPVGKQMRMTTLRFVVGEHSRIWLRTKSSLGFR